MGVECAGLLFRGKRWNSSYSNALLILNFMTVGHIIQN